MLEVGVEFFVGIVGDESDLIVLWGYECEVIDGERALGALSDEVFALGEGFAVGEEGCGDVDDWFAVG